MDKIAGIVGFWVGAYRFCRFMGIGLPSYNVKEGDVYLKMVELVVGT